MVRDAFLNTKRDAILQLAAQHGATNVRVFGSVAHGEAGPQSDVDFLVDLAPGCSLLDRAELLADLKELLGRQVDVVTERSLYWLLRRRIVKEAQPL